ncbi:MAG: hypothetical protein JKY89_10255 [Immundisolibacteraceae bacterium]|nr:hypothetical protein [Immundisolibacteraceae bacterium]
MNSPLIERYLKLIETLNLRERVLFTLSAVAVLFLIIDLTLLGPISGLQKQASMEVTQWQGKLALLELDAAKLGLSNNQGDFLSRMGYAKQLQNQISEQDQAINASLSTMIRPDQFSKVFADLLKKQGSLELSSLQSAVDEELIDLEAITEASREQDNQATPGATNSAINPGLGNALIRTNFNASYRGNYQNTRQFLNLLADMPWALLWRQLQFEVTDHPSSTIDLQAYTLGTGS